MATKWTVVFLVAIAGITVSADIAADFPENVRRGASSRIVSGWEARDGQFPFQLSLRMINPVGGVSSCGATVIHAEWGMTAAHCTAGRLSFVLRNGVNLTRPDVIFETTEFYNHPLYDSNRPSVVQPHDIAIMRFGRALTFSDRLQPIRLQSSKDMNRNYDGVQLVASGWGRTWTNGASPENLNWVFLSGTSNFLCWITYAGSNIIQDSTICAGHYNVTSQSTCQGDSGGPLTVVDVDGKLSQVGISSFVSATGCHTETPAGFIRPGHYHDWFRDVTGINFDWDPEASSEESSSEESSSEESSSSSSESESEETEATTAEPETEATTAEPETEATTAEPETEATTAEPETEVTTAEPETEATTAEPETEATTAEPETEATTSEPETEATTAEPETEATTSEPETEATTAEPETEATTAEPETEATTAEPETEVTTAEPEPETEATTAEPETEATTAEPETEATTAEPETEATTAEPETEATTAEPETEATTAEPETEATTAEPETEATTAEPETEATTAEPETEATTSEPETEETTDEPETEEEDNFFVRYFVRRFWA